MVLVARDFEVFDQVCSGSRGIQRNLGHWNQIESERRWGIGPLLKSWVEKKRKGRKEGEERERITMKEEH